MSHGLQDYYNSVNSGYYSSSAQAERESARALKSRLVLKNRKARERGARTRKAKNVLVGLTKVELLRRLAKLSKSALIELLARGSK